MSSLQLGKQFSATSPAPACSQISVKDETCQHKSPGVRLLVFSSLSTEVTAAFHSDRALGQTRRSRVLDSEFLRCL